MKKRKLILAVLTVCLVLPFGNFSCYGIKKSTKTEKTTTEKKESKNTTQQANTDNNASTGGGNFEENNKKVEEALRKVGSNKTGSLPDKDYDSKQLNLSLKWTKKEAAAQKKIIFQELKSWGMTDQAVAGIMGNISGESGFDSTRTQGSVSWNNCVFGTTGLGLTQWTYWSRQYGLFKRAEVSNRDWLDLGMQLEHLKWEVTKSKYVNFEEYKNLTDVENAMNTFMVKYENPARSTCHYDKRLEAAEDIFDAFEGLEGQSYTGTGVSISEEDKTATLKGASDKQISEWALAGMPDESKLLENQKEIELPTREKLSLGENYSLQIISDSLELQKQVITMENVRVFFAFIGLSLVSYAILLALAMLFDYINNFIDMSLVSVLTLGKVKYSPFDEYSLIKINKSSTSKLLISITVLLIIGFVILSGSVFTFMSDFVYFISERFV